MIFLCAAADVPTNTCRRHSRGRLGALALFNLDGRFYATDDRCSHGNASLAAGDIDEGIIYCPLHAGGFDIATGMPVHPPCDLAIRTYRVAVQDGGIYMVDDVEA